MYANSIGMDFVELPAGGFLMGCSIEDFKCSEDEKPQHKVKITESFYLGKYEVTQGQWKRVMGNNPSEFQNCGDDCPVEQVSWKDTQEFIKKLCELEIMNPCKYRLPTEAEWEYATRTGSQSSSLNTKVYTNGNNKSILGEYAWYGENSGLTTHPIGQKKPNGWRLFDMIGNVSEWVDDYYDDRYYFRSPIRDPKNVNSAAYLVVRGGSWISGDYRLSSRSSRNPGDGDGSRGFRLVFLP
jgi:formylglycine-generating enzyme required for sulfatase activity